MSVLDLQERFLDISAPYWRDNLDMQNVFYAGASEVVRTDTRVMDYLINEFLTDTMSSWGLTIQEYRYGLRDNIQRTLEERRGRLRAAKRGGRNATIADMELVAAGFVGGEVDITIDYDNFVANIRFVGVLGIPSRLPDVQAAMHRALPAQYGITYTYRYQTWNEYDGYALTWNQIDALAIDWDAFETYKP